MLMRAAIHTRADAASYHYHGSADWVSTGVVRRAARRVGVIAGLVAGVLAVAVTPVFASAHLFSASFAGPGSGDGQLALASNTGLAVNDTTHDVYVADTGNARVEQFSSTGVFIRAWGWGVADGTTNALQTCTTGCHAGISGSGAGQLTSPTFIAVDNSAGASAGDVYVGDTGDNLVTKFDASGALISSWGSGGQLDGSTATDGPFGSLAGLAVDVAGTLDVFGGGGTMFEFAQDSTFSTDFGTPRGTAPNGLAVDNTGSFYKVPGDPVVEKFDAFGADIGELDPTDNATGLAVDTSTNDLYVEQGGSSISHFAPPPDCDPSVAPDCAPVDSFGSGHLNGAAGLAVDSSNGRVYAADSGDQTIVVFAPPLPGAPIIDGTSVTGVTPTSADLRAVVNPDLLASTYHFQYGTSTAYGQSTPESSLPGADYADHDAGAHIQGLAANTTYHYRVVASNSAATSGVAGPDQTFTTQAPRTAFALPDNRGYELVTPAVKGAGALFAPGDTLYSFGAGYRASVSGDKLAYISINPFPGSPAGGAENYVASRGANGWSSQDVDPRLAPAHGNLSTPKVSAYTSDLSKAVFPIGDEKVIFQGKDDPPLVPGEPANNANLFLRDNTNASYQLLNVTPPGVTPASTFYEGSSPDLSHVVFDSVAQLTPDALSGIPNLYQWVGGTISLVGQIPVYPAVRCGSGGPACVPATSGAALVADPFLENILNAVSPDGSKIFFHDNVTNYLYMRENGSSTVQVNASEKTNGTGPGGTDPNGPEPAYDYPPSTDGSKVFFTSCEQLTNDSTAVASGQCPGGASGQGGDLYRYDTAGGGLTDLTVDHHGDPLGADVRGFLGSSADGSYVYFVANGVLANGASLGDCTLDDSFIFGQCNLYLSHGGTRTFIARLDGSDLSDWSARHSRAFTARVTSDGSRLAFESRVSLTGYDNKVATGGTCAQSIYAAATPSASCQEVFLYDARSGELRCASCNPSGARPLGPANLTTAGEHANLGGTKFDYSQRNLSDDGRLFFDSADGLVSGDVNGKADVYEYTDGRPYLISSGVEGHDSTFIDASPSGNDVFFETAAQLVGQDVDQRSDIYDARVGGGFPFSASDSGSCVGDACRTAPGGAGSAPLVGSVAFTGPGNPVVSVPVGRSAVRVLSRGARGARFGLRVRVSGAGRVTVHGNQVKTVSRPVEAAGTYVVRVVLSANGQRALRRRHRLRLGLRVGFAPVAGKSSSAVVSLTVKA
jgi:NHL repeat